MQDVDEKKRKRLERNRESARECRKRKKEKKLSLRAQLASLEAENLQLRLKLQVGHESTERASKSAFITSQLDSMIKEGANETDIHKTIQEMQERFSDYGRDRRSAINFHVSQLRRCLQPTQTTRAILWLMSVVPQFHDPINGEITPKDGGEVSDIFFSLLNEIKPSLAQRKQMISFTVPNEHLQDPFGDINRSTDRCSAMLNRIEEIICDKNNSLDSEMNNIQSILSARQIAKFILWIDQNPACMQMLEALWPHISNAGGSGNFASRIPSSDGGKSAAYESNNEDSDDDSSDSEDSS